MYSNYFQAINVYFNQIELFQDKDEKLCIWNILNITIYIRKFWFDENIENKKVQEFQKIDMHFLMKERSKL